jgi:pimeloyl-ACP methyl ester carboxylesterase
LPLPLGSARLARLAGCAYGWRTEEQTNDDHAAPRLAAAVRNVPPVVELEVPGPAGRVLRAYDTGPETGGSGLTVVWHHGSPQSGRLPDPLREAAAARDIRLLSYGRPSYGGSTPQPGRTVGDGAADVVAVLDAAGVQRVAAMGASGGGPIGLAGAALRPDRVVAVVTLAGVAPHTEDFDWYAGMTTPGGLLTGADGRAARAAYAETATFDEASFTTADYAALDGAWSSMGEDAGRAGQETPDGLIDDDVATAQPWGFDVSTITVPVLLVHGREDRVVPFGHSAWLLDQLPDAELWVRPRDGHISVLMAVPVALDWLLAATRG